MASSEPPEHIAAEHKSSPDTYGTHLGRRSFLGAIGAGLAVGYGASAAARFPDPNGRTVPQPATPSAPPRPTPKTAKNLIFMVADGMSMGTLQLADLRIRQTRDRRSHWVSLIENDPESRRTIVDTASFNSLVTDSAAASTAWGLGTLAENGRIGEIPDGRHLAPLLLRARESGKATGLVTSTRLTHATPAGFSCNVFGGSRNDEGRIAKQLVQREYNLLLGGGASFLNEYVQSASRTNTVRGLRELNNLVEQHTTTEFNQRNRLVGLFTDSHMAYELDRPDDQPSLAQMTRSALNWLSDAPGGFLVQIEGGRVDHAAHSNDAGSLIADQVAFDDALGVALEFTRSRDDTLLIITTDHGNANPGLTDYTRIGIEGFARLEQVTRSFDWITNTLRGVDPNDADHVHSVIELATNISISRRDLEIIRRWLSGDAVQPFLLANKNFGPLGSVLANYTKVAFLSPNHTADFVEFTAMGPGSDRFGPITSIDKIHDGVCSALDLPTSRLLEA